MLDKRRVFFNLIASYGRTILAVAVGLFSVRFVLAALGTVDYGLNNVVGAIITFVGYFNVTISNAVSRYYAYAIGADEAGDKGLPSACAWFNTALSLHLIMAIALTLIAAVIGETAIRCYLNIPADRMGACLCVLRFSLVSLFLSCLSAPYLAMFYAKQNIVELSVYGLCSTVCTGLIAFSLSFLRFDKLIAYSLLMVSANSVILLIQVVRAHIIFPRECHISFSLWFSMSRMKDLTGFIGLNMVRTVGELVRGQGSAFVINMVWTPVVNAAYAIGNQVSAQTISLSSALQNALSPAVITEAGAGRDDTVYRIILKMEWTCALLVLVFAAPLSFEIDYVLELWLVNPPPYASTFCVAMVLMLLLERMAAGHCTALESYKKLFPYNIIEGLLSVLTLPLLYVSYLLGRGPEIVGVCFVVLSFLKMLLRVGFVRRQIGFSAAMWGTKVLMPVCGITLVTCLFCWLVHGSMETSFKRLLVSSLASAFVCGGLTWIFMLNISEKKALFVFLKKVINK